MIRDNYRLVLSHLSSKILRKRTLKENQQSSSSKRLSDRKPAFVFNTKVIGTETVRAFKFKRFNRA